MNDPQTILGREKQTWYYFFLMERKIYQNLVFTLDILPCGNFD